MRILAAVDVHEGAQAVLDAAVPWARRLKGKLDVGFASEWSTAGLPEPPQPSDQLDQLWREWNDHADEERRLLDQVWGAVPSDVRGRSQFWAGRAVEVLPDVASGYDLVVTATHSRKGLQRVLLGSVTARVLRHAPVPVLVVGIGDPVPDPSGRLLVLAPVDEGDAGALPWIRDHLGGERVEVVHVQRPTGWPTLAEAAAEPLRRAEVLEHLLRERAGAYGFPGAPVHMLTRLGSNAGDSIAELAASLDTDVIVLPTHGRSALQQLFVGSVAERVAERAPCPVIVVPLAKIGA